MRVLELVCERCGAPYKPLTNLGSWQCPKMRVYYTAREKWVSVPADHGGPYTDSSTFTVPSYVKRWLDGVQDDAIVQKSKASGESDYRAVIVYENNVISRVNPAAYRKTQEYCYIPKQPISYMARLSQQSTWF